MILPQLYLASRQHLFKALLPDVLVKMLFNKISIKCFINIYYSLIAFVGNVYSPRRTQMKCSKVLHAGVWEGDDSSVVCTHCMVCKCRYGSNTWMVRVPFSDFPVQFQHSVAGGLWRKATTACLCSSERGGQQGWHGFSSVYVLHKANIAKGDSQRLETGGMLGSACSSWSSTVPWETAASSERKGKAESGSTFQSQ